MKIAIITVGDARDLRNWSGTTHYIANALLETPSEVAFIDGKPLDFLARVVNKLAKVLKQRFEVRQSLIFARLGGVWCSTALARSKADVVVAIAASPFVAFLNTTKPVVYISDATFAGVQRLYPEFRELPAWQRSQGDRLERLGLGKATTVVYPSRWAETSAIDDYDTAPGKIMVVPFGANLPARYLTGPVAGKQLPTNGPIKILYVSVNWIRKRGDIVVDAVRLLNARGVRAKAYLVGIIPPEIESDAAIEVVGFLRKSDEAELRKLMALFQEAHVFMLPTIAECFGTVFSEAQAFATPCLAFDVGGTPGAVADGVTGALLPLSATAIGFADYIQALTADPERYREMSAACRRRYEGEANWASFVNSFLCEADPIG